MQTRNPLLANHQEEKLRTAWWVVAALENSQATRKSGLGDCFVYDTAK